MVVVDAGYKTPAIAKMLIDDGVNPLFPYNILRSRLNKKHLVNANERGILRIDLPRFREYVEMWHAKKTSG